MLSLKTIIFQFQQHIVTLFFDVLESATQVLFQHFAIAPQRAGVDDDDTEHAHRHHNHRRCSHGNGARSLIRLRHGFRRQIKRLDVAHLVVT